MVQIIKLVTTGSTGNQNGFTGKFEAKMLERVELDVMLVLLKSHRTLPVQTSMHGSDWSWSIFGQNLWNLPPFPIKNIYIYKRRWMFHDSFPRFERVRTHWCRFMENNPLWALHVEVLLTLAIGNVKESDCHDKVCSSSSMSMSTVSTVFHCLLSTVRRIWCQSFISGSCVPGVLPEALIRWSAQLKGEKRASPRRF